MKHVTHVYDFYLKNKLKIHYHVTFINLLQRKQQVSEWIHQSQAIRG